MRTHEVKKKSKSMVTPAKRLHGLLHEGQHANVQSILHTRRIQPKLQVGQPNDKYEQEADRVAEQVMRMPDTLVQRQFDEEDDDEIIQAKPVSIQRMCDECEESLQRKPNAHSDNNSGQTTVNPQVDAQLGAIGGGQPLSRQIQSYFEPRFGHDFSHVRIHTGAKAEQSAQTINAKAYTVGRDIVFGAGQYTPQSNTGKRLLAHELTHVVQQNAGTTKTIQRVDQQQNGYKPAGGIDVSQQVRKPFLQRSCGATAAAAGRAAACPTSTSNPAGERVLFTVNCDTFLNAAEQQKVEDFADSMNDTDIVSVHGLASVDGNADFNDQLSCARAERAVTLMTGRGVPVGQIRKFRHGEVAGPASETRSVMLERNPDVVRAPTPQLNAAIVTGPTIGNCGNTVFTIRWSLTRNSSANGGFVIQDVDFNWDVRDCAGTTVPNPDPRTSPLSYFEAWRVPANTTSPNATAFTVDTDRFFWPGAAPWAGRCSTGNVTISAEASYFDNVAAGALPAHMTPFNGATFANDLPSSLTDPALTGTESRTLQHDLTFHWNCCPCATNATVIDGHIP